MRRVMIAGALLAAACGGNADTSTTSAGSSTTGGGSTTTTGAAATTTVAATTTAAAGPALTESDGVYTINWGALQGVFFVSPVAGDDDPYFQVHTSAAVDGFFLSLEAYTVYGPEWTGQLGTFPIDCSIDGTGICLHFDPDGTGPAGDLGADFLATGNIEILQADADGFVAILTDVAFSDGSTIAGPLTVTG